MTCRLLSILHPPHPHHLLVVAWKHRFSALCLSDLHNTAFGAKTPSYKVITDLDKKVRNFYTPPSLQIPGFGGSKMATHVEQPSVELTMQRYIAFAIREISEYSLSLSLSHTHTHLSHVDFQRSFTCTEAFLLRHWKTIRRIPWEADTGHQSLPLIGVPALSSV